uniref:Uncharacterized protein n=1 Tax=viral metagenome TaxID=1070528 RepID=A0A6M3M9A3_9ZZZZ
MFEKENLLIHIWNGKFGYSECSAELLASLAGKPVVIYVAGVRQEIGVCRKARYGAAGLTVDLVLSTTEKLGFSKSEEGVITFKEIYMDYPHAIFKPPILGPKIDPLDDCEASATPEILLEPDEIKPEIEKDIGGPDEEISEP